jgi:DNA (cytosine-5)-methyltransferase 1
MKAVSLFAGVGGFDLALERNGAEVVASVEIDKHARKILSKQFPNSTILEDVKSVTKQQLFDLGFNSDGIIVGGFPCQDVSVAGKRAGLSDSNGNATRSGLFWEVVRLLEETKAQHFILENVPGLLSSNEGRDFGIILNALVELGYGVSWRILDAQYFGVPQRRRRIFIVGHLGNDGRTSAEILAIAESRSRYLEASQQTGKATARKVGASITPYRESSFGQFLENEVGTLKASGGNLGGGGSETLLALSKPVITKA